MYLERGPGHASHDRDPQLKQCKKPGCKKMFDPAGNRIRKYCDEHSAYIKQVGK